MMFYIMMFCIIFCKIFLSYFLFNEIFLSFFGDESKNNAYLLRVKVGDIYNRDILRGTKNNISFPLILEPTRASRVIPLVPLSFILSLRYSRQITEPICKYLIFGA